MKVLLQEWRFADGPSVNSISINRAQLHVWARAPEVITKGGRLIGDPLAVEIPDDHGLAEMVTEGTVFLQDDELDIIKYPTNS